jgi:dolichyl-phosphate-mannose--protein O-mannosyl transferase
MHFAQTRIATIDVYVTFFIMLMYLFMFKYYTMSFYDAPFRKTLVPLALSGIFMGLGVAAKWTGAYAGMGLAVVFFYTMLQRYNEYRDAVKNRQGTSNGIPNRRIIDEFTPKLTKTLYWCVLFFVAVPVVIYCCSYIPYMNTPSGDGLKTVITNMNSMYAYHAKTVLDSTHSFSSMWYQWPVMTRPIWYYSGTISSTVKEGISSFGNPAVWWTGIAALFYVAYIAIKEKDRNAQFLVIAYFAQLVPWMGVSRLTFIYHYFPCVPFVVLMIGYAIYDIYESARSKKSIAVCAFALVIIAIALFALFYPVLSGQPCEIEFAKDWLKWFDSWVLL